MTGTQKNEELGIFLLPNLTSDPSHRLKQTAEQSRKRHPQKGHRMMPITDSMATDYVQLSKCSELLTYYS